MCWAAAGVCHEFSGKGVAASPIGQRAHIVEHVGSDNQKQTYYAATSMWLKLEQLQIVQQLVEPLDMGNQPTLSTSLHGVAVSRGRSCRSWATRKVRRARFR